jgi:hypothetical protein
VRRWAVTDVPCHQLLDARRALLAIEAALHCPDLTAGLPAAPAPETASLALVRRTLDGLLAVTMPGNWDDIGYALKALAASR